MKNRDEKNLWIALCLLFGIAFVVWFITWPASYPMTLDHSLDDSLAAKGVNLVKVDGLNILQANIELDKLGNQTQFIGSMTNNTVLYTISETFTTNSLTDRTITIKFFQIQHDRVIEFDQVQHRQAPNMAYSPDNMDLRGFVFYKNTVLGVVEGCATIVIFAILAGGFIWLVEWFWDATEGIRIFLRPSKKQ